MKPGERLRELLRARSTERTGSADAIPMATVSGVASTTPGMISWFDRQTAVTMITTKSYQRSPNPGNREPIITEAGAGNFGNAVGLRNPGIRSGVRELSRLRAQRPMGALLAVSLSAMAVDEFVRLARESASVADLLELNYSCPHATRGYGADIGRDAAAIARITQAVVDAAGELPVLVKLTPNVPRIEEMARVAVEAGAAGVTAVNTVGPEVYLHEGSGAAILTNPPDGRGGQSGAWIRETAIAAVAAIRGTLGPAPVIVGMGGVSSRRDAQQLVAAGADVVGVGSALGRIHQRYWPAFVRRLAGIGEAPPTAPREAAAMDFSHHTVAAHRELGDGLFELDLSPPVPAEPGQSVFLWIPGVGEKPFATAGTRGDVTTFLIRRRGQLTEKLGAVGPAAAVFVRGPYGDRWAPPPPLPAPPRQSTTAPAGSAVLIGAGSGIATLPGVARVCREQGVAVISVLGLRHAIRNGAVLDALAEAGQLELVPDEGETGRVLTRLPAIIAQAAGAPGIAWAWICGPDAFMREAARRVAALGIPRHRIFLSLERMMRCGVGMCGECHHHGHLTCQFGTVISAEEDHE